MKLKRNLVVMINIIKDQLEPQEIGHYIHVGNNLVTTNNHL
jgi:hypothetical protein